MMMATKSAGRILVVEDEEDLRSVMELLLNIEGYDVIAVESGEDALQHTDEVDAILLDIRLPGISGIDVARQLDEEQRRRVLFMSAHADRENHDVAQEHGCAGFLAKPFDFDDMCQRLHAMMA